VDDRLRALERLDATGDREATEALLVARARAGLPDPRLEVAARIATLAIRRRSDYFFSLVRQIVTSGAAFYFYESVARFNESAVHDGAEAALDLIITINGDYQTIEDAAARLLRETDIVRVVSDAGAMRRLLTPEAFGYAHEESMRSARREAESLFPGVVRNLSQIAPKPGGTLDGATEAR
jgi:hypothetical protein